jgi:pimeloyl-ACP methyl ester carboxylesterase
VVLHGGPGAPGSAGGLARALAADFRVFEPFQRGCDAEPLTVVRHVADLGAYLSGVGGNAPPPLVGHSWGAMLALALAAAHPERAGPLVLVGCGTFDPAARARLVAIRAERAGSGDPDSYDPSSTPDEPEEGEFVERAHLETWGDMLRLQAEGVYPAAFARVRSPVLMLHGGHDPHPGPMIRDGLRVFVPHLEYREFERCGHYPWRERHAREEFLAVLAEWLRLNGSRASR